MAVANADRLDDSLSLQLFSLVDASAGDGEWLLLVDGGCISEVQPLGRAEHVLILGLGVLRVEHLVYLSVCI